MNRITRSDYRVCYAEDTERDGECTYTAISAGVAAEMFAEDEYDWDLNDTIELSVLNELDEEQVVEVKVCYIKECTAL